MQIEPVSILSGGSLQYNSAEVWSVGICEISRCLPLLVPDDVAPVLAIVRLHDGHLLPLTNSGCQAISLSEQDSLGGGGGTPPGLLLDHAVDDESLLLLKEGVPGLLVDGDEHCLLVVGVPGALVQGRGGGGVSELADKGECTLLFFKGEPTTCSAPKFGPKQ